MPSSPLVSIVLPTYNGSRYLRESIESCLVQDYPHFELVIVDDCSIDATPAILAEFSDPRIRVIRHDRNRKLPAALNTGFRSTRGDLLTWTSDDNRYLPHTIGRLVEALTSHPNAGLVYAGFWLIDAQGRRLRGVAAEGLELLPRKNVIHACFMYRREVYEHVGDYNEGLFRIEDYDYWLRVAAKFPICCIPELLYEYRTHPHSLTNEESLPQRAAAFDELHTRHYGADAGRFDRVLGEMLVARAFDCYIDKNFDKVPHLVLQGLRRNHSLLRNRGVWSILFRSLLKKGYAPSQ